MKFRIGPSLFHFEKLFKPVRIVLLFCFRPPAVELAGRTGRANCLALSSSVAVVGGPSGWAGWPAGGLDTLFFGFADEYLNLIGIPVVLVVVGRLGGHGGRHASVGRRPCSWTRLGVRVLVWFGRVGGGIRSGIFIFPSDCGSVCEGRSSDRRPTPWPFAVSVGTCPRPAGGCDGLDSAAVC